MSGAFLRVGDVVLHHRVVDGSAERLPLVFSNSLGTDFRIWDGVVERLAGTRPIVLYDKRGHGLSDLGTPPYRIDDHVADLAGLLDALALPRVVVCGLSVGGLVAQGLHAAHPGRVAALVLADTAHRIGDDALWNARIDAVREHGLASIADATLERWFSARFLDPANAAAAGYRNLLVRASAEGYAGTCAAVRDADFSEQARRIDVPTLCLVGEHDVATPPALVAELAARIPGARLETIAGAGHLPCVERPDVTARLVADFLDELERAT